MIQRPTKSSPVISPLPTASRTNEVGYCHAARIHSQAICP
jgi:hypothetical protein